jgi:hypothetical protein
MMWDHHFCEVDVGWCEIGCGGLRRATHGQEKREKSKGKATHPWSL